MGKHFCIKTYDWKEGKTVGIQFQHRVNEPTDFLMLTSSHVDGYYAKDLKKTKTIRLKEMVDLHSTIP